MARQNEKGEWQRPEAVEGELNSELDEGIVSFIGRGVYRLPHILDFPPS